MTTTSTPRPSLASCPPPAFGQRHLTVSHDRIGDVLMGQGNLAAVIMAVTESQGNKKSFYWSTNVTSDRFKAAANLRASGCSSS